MQFYGYGMLTPPNLLTRKHLWVMQKFPKFITMKVIDF